jgi:hypothetical protein
LKKDGSRGVDNISGWDSDADHQGVVLETDLGAENGASLVVYMTGAVTNEGGEKDELTEKKREGEGGGPGQVKSLADLLPEQHVLDTQADEQSTAEAACLQQGWRSVAAQP